MIKISDFYCPITLTLKASPTIINENDNLPESDVDYSPVLTKWCDEKRAEFQSKFDKNKIEELIHIFDTLEPSNTNQSDLNNFANTIASMGTQAGKDTGISKQATNSNNNPRARKQNKPWFDHDCLLKSKQYIRVKK